MCLQPQQQLTETADEASSMSTVSPPQGTWEGKDDILASQVKSHACNWSLRSAQGNVPKRCYVISLSLTEASQRVRGLHTPVSFDGYGP